MKAKTVLKIFRQHFFETGKMLNETDIGKRNNQNFVTIPHTKLIEQIIYKPEFDGIPYLQFYEVFLEESAKHCIGNGKFLQNEVRTISDS